MMTKLVVVSDLQIGYQDDESLASVSKFLKDFQPDTFVMNGDIIDMTSLSRFALTLEERASLSVQRFGLLNRLVHWRQVMPYAKMVYVMGNHEERLQRYMTENAPELEGLLNFRTFAGLDEINVTLVEPYGAGYEWPERGKHKVLITHGELIRVNTAAANMEVEGGSGITGHTHRLSSHYRTNRTGAHAWYEGGCLCRIDGVVPPARPGVQNWQQGFIVGYATERMWNVYQVSITNHQFVWGGKLYAP